MCGIICEICFYGANKFLDHIVLQRIKNRGPDCVNTSDICTSEGAQVSFCGAVLWMQGLQLTQQPLENDRGILLYNGDIFDESWDDNISDTLTIMNKLSHRTVELTERHIVNELKSLRGPFSIIYYDKSSENLYFTRDRIGRSSLLFNKTDSSIVISNVLGRKYNCVEIPATHIYILNIKTKRVKVYSWLNNETDEYLIEDLYDSFKRQQNIPDEDFTVDSMIDLNYSDEEGVIEYIKSVAKKEVSSVNVMNELLEHTTIKTTVNKLTTLLEKSVEIRLRRQPNKCKECILDAANSCRHATIGVLFSGGLDCTILAFLADRYVSREQSIDLINVAFKKDTKGSYNVPDRLTGRQSFEELKALCPSSVDPNVQMADLIPDRYILYQSTSVGGIEKKLRVWNFKEVNVPQEELEEFQIKTIADLVYPRKTILDESLGSALWFASRGQDNNSVSPCRVLLLGSGADELFGGYKRHYNAFKRLSWPGLNAELNLDWKRISFRNLARDNRVICDHGRQPRMPYLDEQLTDYVLGLKPWLKCYPCDDLGPGVGDKLLLRLLAFNIGLRDVVTLPKRALQFGSRIANKKEKGSELSKTFLNN